MKDGAQASGSYCYYCFKTIEITTEYANANMTLTKMVNLVVDLALKAKLLAYRQRTIAVGIEHAGAITHIAAESIFKRRKESSKEASRGKCKSVGLFFKQMDKEPSDCKVQVHTKLWNGKRVDYVKIYKEDDDECWDFIGEYAEKLEHNTVLDDGNWALEEGKVAAASDRFGSSGGFGSPTKSDKDKDARDGISMADFNEFVAKKSGTSASATPAPTAEAPASSSGGKGPAIDLDEIRPANQTKHFYHPNGGKAPWRYQHSIKAHGGKHR